MSLATDLFGSKPVVPKWNPLNLGGEQQAAIANNLAAEPGARNLANLNEEQLLAMLSKVDPGFAGDSEQIGKNISSMLKGEIPADVSRQIQSADAAKSLGGGYAGSGASHALVARDLGLNSLQLTREGLNSAESWLGATEKLLAPAMHTYESMFVTPSQQAGFDTEERNSKFAHDYLQNQINAMPDPASAGTLNGVLGFLGTMRGGGGTGGAAPTQVAPGNPIGQNSSNSLGVNYSGDWNSPFNGADQTDNPAIWGNGGGSDFGGEMGAGAGAAAGAASWADFAGEMTI